MIDGSASTYDNFKIKALAASSVDTNPDTDVPAPASLLVFGPALFAMGVIRRRARKRLELKKSDETEETNEDA